MGFKVKKMQTRGGHVRLLVYRTAGHHYPGEYGVFDVVSQKYQIKLPRGVNPGSKEFEQLKDQLRAMHEARRVLDA